MGRIGFLMLIMMYLTICLLTCDHSTVRGNLDQAGTACDSYRRAFVLKFTADEEKMHAGCRASRSWEHAEI